MELKVILKDLLFLVSYEFFAFYIFRPILVLIEVNLAVSWNQFHRMKFASVKRETKKKILSIWLCDSNTHHLYLNTKLVLRTFYRSIDSFLFFKNILFYFEIHVPTSFLFPSKILHKPLLEIFQTHGFFFHKLLLQSCIYVHVHF